MEREQWYADHDQNVYPVFVAVDDRVAGWISLGSYWEERQDLTRVAKVSYYIDEKERRKGIGRIDEQLADHLYYGLKL